MSQTETRTIVRKTLPSEVLKVKKMDSELVPRWYFGGLAGAGACLFTHPLDLLKVVLQTKGQAQGSIFKTVSHMVHHNGVFSLWNGVSASLLRQITYSTTRFAIYDMVKDQLSTNYGHELHVYEKIALAGFAGAIGSFVGCPGDTINVRMQNDMKLPLDQRRNYKHAFDGVYRISREEGFTKLWSGATMAIARGTIVSIGQIAAYDQYKTLMIAAAPDMFSEKSVFTHFTASFFSGVTATLITQPFDVMKTRLMSNRSEYRSVLHCALEIFKESPFLGFFKGFVPAFVRLAPHTMLMFLFKEQLTINFGELRRSA